MFACSFVTAVTLQYAEATSAATAVSYAIPIAGKSVIAGYTTAVSTLANTCYRQGYGNSIPTTCYGGDRRGNGYTKALCLVL